MSDPFTYPTRLPLDQQAIRDKCFHPSGTFEFEKKEIEQSIPARFEKIVRLYPHRLPVKAGQHSLMHDKFNRAANRIPGAILAIHGKGSEPAALLFERGVSLIAATLATLRTGKFYVGRDPSFPFERIAYVFDDSQAGLIVTTKRDLELAQKLTSNLSRYP